MNFLLLFLYKRKVTKKETQVELEIFFFKGGQQNTRVKYIIVRTKE